ncbi:MAG: hypothetical protein Q9227_000206 [Pyrenula ochraceoflavens]
MRDDHFNRSHQSKVVTTASAMTDPDDDEIQPLLFDLIAADKVESVRGLLAQFEKLSSEVKDEIFNLVASSGSPEMLDLIFEKRLKDGPAMTSTKKMIGWACKTSNLRTFGYLIHKLDLLPVGPHHPFALVLPEVLRSDSDEIKEEWMNNLDLREKPKNKVPFESNFLGQKIINATESQPYREDFLLSVWKRLDLPQSCGKAYIGDALVNVASTTCSVTLASFLLEQGVSVDYRRSAGYPTALRHAARKTSLEAAELMKFLLMKGANPDIIGGDKISRFSEKGAKGISKWLGMSWDELVAHVHEERQEQERQEKKRQEEERQKLEREAEKRRKELHSLQLYIERLEKKRQEEERQKLEREADERREQRWQEWESLVGKSLRENRRREQQLLRDDDILDFESSVSPSPL